MADPIQRHAVGLAQAGDERGVDCRAGEIVFADNARSGGTIAAAAYKNVSIPVEGEGNRVGQTRDQRPVQ